MDAVGLDGSGNVDEVFVDHGSERYVMLLRESVKDLVKRLNIVGAIVGRQRDAGEQDFDVRGFEAGEHLIEIAACLLERKTAQPVVAAELDDDDLRVLAKDGGETGDSVFGSGSADALVDDFVAVALGVELPLQSRWEGLAVLQAVAGSNAVAEAD